MRFLNFLRPAVFLEVGLILTFTHELNTKVGLTALTSFGIGFALVNVFVTMVQKRKLTDVETLPLTTVALLMALVAAQVPASLGAITYRILVSAWGFISGGIEFELARRAGFNTRKGRDHRISLFLNLALGVLFAVAHLGPRDSVGFLGAYMTITAVFTGIAVYSEDNQKSA
ncbi:MAG: hypothetical protein ACKOWK_06490 [Micrococcales bacterium]